MQLTNLMDKKQMEDREINTWLAWSIGIIFTKSHTRSEPLMIMWHDERLLLMSVAHDDDGE